MAPRIPPMSAADGSVGSGGAVSTNRVKSEVTSLSVAVAVLFLCIKSEVTSLSVAVAVLFLCVKSEVKTLNCTQLKKQEHNYA